MASQSEKPVNRLPLHVQRLGLSRNPFPPTPDAESFFRGECVERGYAELLHSVLAGKGFVLVTGEVGTGKTTLLRRLLADLHAQDARVAWVFNVFLQGEELLATILKDFGLTPTGSMAADVERLNAFLLEQHAAGHECVLLLDDAQQLDAASLELVRLLSNLETRQAKLLQIVLCGQDELEGGLADRRLRQLASRIGLHLRLQPLTPAEVTDYVRFRLAHAGAGDRIRLGRGAAQRIYRLTGGNPRRVHQLMDRALYGVLGSGDPVIHRSLVDEAASELQLTLGRAARPRRWAQAAVVLVAVAAVTWYAFGPRLAQMPWPGDALASWQAPWAEAVETRSDTPEPVAGPDIAVPEGTQTGQRDNAGQATSDATAMRIPELVALDFSARPQPLELPEEGRCLTDLGLSESRAAQLLSVEPEQATSQALWLAGEGWVMVAVPKAGGEMLGGLADGAFCQWTAKGARYALTAGTLPDSPDWNARVTWLQTRLAEAGFYEGAIDGVFGPKTESGLIRMLEQVGITEVPRLDGWTQFLVLVVAQGKPDSSDEATTVGPVERRDDLRAVSGSG
ncbi:MAG: AAA family ATPase [Halothiobacillaceae bacterium]